MSKAAPRPFEAPELRELDLLSDQACGFSEPPPPGGDSQGGSSNSGSDSNNKREAYDWL